MNLDLIIFDCDGVLIDSEPVTCQVIARELTKQGLPFSSDEISRRFTGIPSVDMFAELEAESGMTLPLDFSVFVEDCVIEAYRKTLEPIAGTAETIANLPWRSCVASSSKPQKLCIGLMETGLFELFYPDIYATALVPRGKPAPDIFLYVAERMGAHPDRCVVIEDSVAGVTAARAAGMRVLGFTGGSHCWDDYEQGLITAGAHSVFSRFSDLPELLHALVAAE
jgi:beta-phosphoglucomutase-like phosphatase (HAD superfamily)